jgi:hypothetical protein
MPHTYDFTVLPTSILVQVNPSKDSKTGNPLVNEKKELLMDLLLVHQFAGMTPDAFKEFAQKRDPILRKSGATFGVDFEKQTITIVVTLVTIDVVATFMVGQFLPISSLGKSTITQIFTTLGDFALAAGANMDIGRTAVNNVDVINTGDPGCKLEQAAKVEPTDADQAARS